MFNTIHYISIFVTLIIITSGAMGDAFDVTIDQILLLETDLEQNRIEIEEKNILIEEELKNFRANHELNGPKGEFESDDDYVARLSLLTQAVTQRREELEKEHLTDLQTRRLDLKSEIALLNRRHFYTTDVIATLGRYDANDEYFPITFESNNQRGSVRLYISRLDDAPNLKENWDKVVKAAYFSIDPGYQQGLAAVQLEYPILWENGVTWIFNQVYDLGNNNSIAFSPDGKYIATASNDEHGITDIWTVEDGKKFRKMDHGDWVEAVDFSPDGRYLVTAGQDETRSWWHGKAIIWDLDKGTKVHDIKHPSYVYAAAFSPDGVYLSTARQPQWWSGRANLWNVSNGNWVRSMTYRARSNTIQAVTFTPNGKSLITGNQRSAWYLLDKATLWEVSSGNIQWNFEHENGVYAVDFSPNGKYLVTGNDKSFTLWEMSSGKSVRQIELNNSTAYAVTFSPDGGLLAVRKSNGYIDIFRVGTEEITLETDIPKVRSIWTGRKVTDLAWHPSGNIISDGRKVYRTVLPSKVVNLIPTTLHSSIIDPVKSGTKFTLDFSVKYVSDLAGWQIEVAFNPDVLSVVEVKEGDFLKSDGGNTFFQSGKTDNTLGKVTDIIPFK